MLASDFCPLLQRLIPTPLLIYTYACTPMQYMCIWMRKYNIMM